MITKILIELGAIAVGAHAQNTVIWQSFDEDVWQGDIIHDLPPKNFVKEILVLHYSFWSQGKQIFQVREGSVKIETFSALQLSDIARADGLDAAEAILSIFCGIERPSTISSILCNHFEGAHDLFEKERRTREAADTDNKQEVLTRYKSFKEGHKRIEWQRIWLVGAEMEEENAKLQLFLKEITEYPVKEEDTAGDLQMVMRPLISSILEEQLDEMWSECENFRMQPMPSIVQLPRQLRVH
ncbi:hypothetical protein Tco_0464272 [Tanacetum coccineum]